MPSHVPSRKTQGLFASEHSTTITLTVHASNPFPMQAARYNIGGYEYTADDLENGILRGNRPPASSIGMLLGLPGLSMGPFGRGDPRADKVWLMAWV